MAKSSYGIMLGDRHKSPIFSSGEFIILDRLKKVQAITSFQFIHLVLCAEM